MEIAKKLRAIPEKKKIDAVYLMIEYLAKVCRAELPNKDCTKKTKGKRTYNLEEKIVHLHQIFDHNPHLNTNDAPAPMEMDENPPARVPPRSIADNATSIIRNIKKKTEIGLQKIAVRRSKKRLDVVNENPDSLTGAAFKRKMVSSPEAVWKKGTVMKPVKSKKTVLFRVKIGNQTTEINLLRELKTGHIILM